MKCFSFAHFLKVQTSRSIKRTYLRQILKNFSCSSCLHDDKLTSNNEEISWNLKQEKGIFQNSQKKSPLSYYVPEQDKELTEKLKEGDIFYPYNGPLDRAYSILAEDVKRTGRVIVNNLVRIKLGELEIKYFPRHTDFLIIGSGAIGLSIAYAIRSKFPHGPSVIVLDVDDTSPHPSTNLGQGMLTQQMFDDDTELQMSLYCAEFLSNFHIHSKIDGFPSFNVSYEPLGTLVLANDENAEDVIKKTEILKEFKADCRILDGGMLKKKFPWLNLDGISFGRLGMINEGIFNPWSFLHSLKCKLVNLGTTFVKAQAIDFGPNTDEPIRVLCRLPDGTYNTINYCFCIIAAGMESINLADRLCETNGFMKPPLPLEERMRYEYCFLSPDGPGLNTPTVVDTDGTYFRREGLLGHYIAGVPSVPADNNEDNTIYGVFENKVKPFLMQRVEQFDKLELVNGWVDRYDYNTVNKIGVIGCHPNFNQIIFATGFANHGIQYAPALGRALMEYIIYGEYQTINLECYHFENLYRKQHKKAEKRKQETLEAEERIALTD